MVCNLHSLLGNFPAIFSLAISIQKQIFAYKPYNKRETIVIVYWYLLTNRLIQPTEIIAQSKIGLR